MMTKSDIYEEMIYLCEVRGELDPESNERIESRLKQLQQMLESAEQVA